MYVEALQCNYQYLETIKKTFSTFYISPYLVLLTHLLYIDRERQIRERKVITTTDVINTYA